MSMMKPAFWLNTRAAGFDADFAAFLSARHNDDADVADAVRAIITDLRARGDAALVEAAKRFDNAVLTIEQLRIPVDEIAETARACPQDVRDALDFAAGRIEAFHKHQMPDDLSFTDAEGVRMGYHWHPIDAAGLYVPGGEAAYPSSLLMNALPARIAGVGRIAMATPARAEHAPLLFAAAERAGVDEIYRAGGAHAIAALAYGTETIAPVDKITGPGNAYVAEAKRQVFGRVGIESIAGPSEILVIADADANAKFIAADLLSQAEHDADAQSILLTDDAQLAEGVCAEVARQIQTLPRADIAGASWRAHGAVILTPRLGSDAPDLANRIAPEHVEVMTRDAEVLAAKIRHAGSVFIGAHTPEAIGDYVGGPNHILPTGRAARYASGLSVFDFLKRTSFLHCGEAGFAQTGGAAETLARAEKLDAHARAIAIRRKT